MTAGEPPQVPERAPITGHLPQLTPGKAFLIGFFFELGLVAVAALLGFWSQGTPFPFRLTFTPGGLLWGLGGTVPVVLMSYALTSSIGLRFQAFRKIYDLLKDFLGDVVRALRFEEILLLSAAAGVGEEVLFRGVVQTVTGEWGLWISSALFGLLHALTPAYFVLTFLFGLYLGWLFEASGSLLAPMIVHWLYDTAAFVLLRRQFQKDAETQTAPGEVRSS